jgi:hypothetical protein
MTEMSPKRRARTTWPLLLVFTSICLGACTTLLTESRGKLACCADLGGGQAAFTSCCSTGEQSSSSDLPGTTYAPAAASVEVPFLITPRAAADDNHRLRFASRVQFRNADPQALLSTFLI